MATVSSLPLHLVADILRMLDNVQDLPYVLLSHRIFYTAYVDTPSLIVDMLRSQLPENLLSLAVASYTSQKSFRDKHDIDPARFLTEFYDKPFDALDGYFHLNLDQALYISRLDHALTALRDEFCECSIRKLYGLSRDDPIPATHERLSAGELYRISRAMYRFHIYGNLFLAQEDAEKCDESQKALFFDRHSPWVNEQLACVYDYLETRLTGVMLTILSATPACREIVVHGFEWGANLTDWLAERSALFEEQRCLSLGLPYLHRLLQASTPEEWEVYLTKANDLCQSCLGDDLEVFNRHKTPNTTEGVWRTREMNKLARQVDMDDHTDDHPRKVWSKVYYDRIQERFRFGAQGLAPMRFVYGLRGIGYVMWDGDRMQDDTCKATFAKAYRGEPIF